MKLRWRRRVPKTLTDISMLRGLLATWYALRFTTSARKPVVGPQRHVTADQNKKQASLPLCLSKVKCSKTMKATALEIVRRRTVAYHTIPYHTDTV